MERKRMIQLIKILSKQQFSIQGSKLCEELNISVRTLRNDIKNMKVELFSNGIEIISKHAVGYSLKINDETKYYQYIENMMKEAQYQDTESQAKLQTYLDAAVREADYADDDLQKTFEHYITRFDNYLENVNVAITNVGSMQNRLEMTKTRVENQSVTIEDLKVANEDRDISDIILDYTAAYNAYQASLTAASKVGDVSLLKYL